MNWKVFLQHLLVAAIGGAAQAVVTQQADWKSVGVGAATAAAFYAVKSPYLNPTEPQAPPTNVSSEPKAGVK